MRPSWWSPILALTSACGSLTPSMRYQPDATPHPRLPVAVAVDVRVAPVTARSPFRAGDEVLLAASLREAVVEDLTTNGPFAPAPSSDVRLVLDIDGYAIEGAETDLYVVVGAATFGAGFVLAPLLGVPIAGREVSMSGRIALVHSSGAVLAQAHGWADATAWTGLWYGREVGLDRAARPLVADLLGKLTVQSEQIARSLDEARADGALARAADAARSQRILAVLDVEGGSVDPEVADQLTEYLATQLAAGGTYRLVPRSAVRAELQAAKAGALDPCYDEACQIELGKAVAAEKTLSPRILRVGETCALTATLFDLRTETAERAASARSGCDASALLASIDRVAAALH